MNNTILILVLSLSVTTQGFIPSFGSGFMNDMSEKVKTLNPFHVLGIFGGGATTPENKEPINPPTSRSGFVTDVAGKLGSVVPMSSTLGKIKSFNPLGSSDLMSSLRMGDLGSSSDRVLVEPTQYVRSGEGGPVLVESSQYVHVL